MSLLWNSLNYFRLTDSLVQNATRAWRNKCTSEVHLRACVSNESELVIAACLSCKGKTLLLFVNICLC
uniref:Uncharacterized protein n=1 Tax=Anguilla anguilla TaxID=7936 RepID=A0A0E9VUU6_ANGAN